MCHTSVDLTSCCIKHTHHGPSGTEVPRLDMCISIKSLSKNSTSDVARSHIQPNKHDNRKSSEDGGWRR